MASGTLGNFELIRELGSGGMGRVYLARDTKLRRLVAIKVVPGSLGEDSRRRLLSEARATCALNHPNIVTVYEVGESAGQDYIVMEYVEGRPLSEVISPGGLNPPDAARYAAEIADALALAHASGLVHRDIKPANISSFHGRSHQGGRFRYCQAHHRDSGRGRRTNSHHTDDGAEHRGRNGRVYVTGAG